MPRVKQWLQTHIPETILRPVSTLLALATLYTALQLLDAFGYLNLNNLGWLGTLFLIFLALAVAAAAWEYWEYPTDIAHVTLNGKITRDVNAFGDDVDCEDIVEAIESADDDTSGAAGLLVEINSPGGEIVPSSEIQHAIEAFEGPTVAYAGDMCASGGYLIASACDDVYLHTSCMMGSIGVVGSQVNLSDLAADHGIDYEQFTAGEFKDAGHPLKQSSDDEREYIQSLIDAHYDRFVNLVAEARDLEPDSIRDLGARVFVGDDAVAHDLADHTGTLDEAKTHLATQVGVEGESLSTTEYETQDSPFGGLGVGAQQCAYAFGAGIASRIDVADDLPEVLGR